MDVWIKTNQHDTVYIDVADPAVRAMIKYHQTRGSRQSIVTTLQGLIHDFTALLR